MDKNKEIESLKKLYKKTKDKDLKKSIKDRIKLLKDNEIVTK